MHFVLGQIESWGAAAEKLLGKKKCIASSLAVDMH